ncbi:MAG: cytochrome c biogenesis protein CcdA [Candidatus Paceibacterota bacterium]|jgi:cytochrome c biogenesis protein CcdA
MTKRLKILLGLCAAIILVVVLAKLNLINLAASSDKSIWLLPLVIIAAIVDSINPCAFSILLLTIAFLFSLGKNRKYIIRTGGIYIFGVFVVYVLIGLGILKTLQLFGVPHFMAKVGASIILVAGLINVINQYFPSFPIKLKIPDMAHARMAQMIEKASGAAAFALGVFVGLWEFPCTGGPYLMVLGLLHDQSTMLSGALYLIIYNIIFVLPLAVILLVSSDEMFLARVQQWKKDETSMMRLLGGAAMIILGIIMFLI